MGIRRKKTGDETSQDKVAPQAPGEDPTVDISVQDETAAQEVENFQATIQAASAKAPADRDEIKGVLKKVDQFLRQKSDDGNKAADALLKEHLAAGKNHAVFLFYMGRTLERLGKTKEAKQAFDRSLNLNLKHAWEPHVQLFDIDDEKAALESAKRSLKIASEQNRRRDTIKTFAKAAEDAYKREDAFLSYGLWTIVAESLSGEKKESAQKNARRAFNLVVLLDIISDRQYGKLPESDLEPLEIPTSSKQQDQGGTDHNKQEIPVV